jgi:hypothetical protein
MEHDHHSEPVLGADLIASLEAGRTVSPLVEERVVQALRARGALRRFAPARLRQRPAAWIVAPIAASLVFLAGFRSGESAEARRDMAAQQNAASVLDSRQVADLVQRRANSYVAALAMVQPDQSEARDAAVGTLRAAADHILRVAPESDMALAMRVAFPMSFADSPAALAAKGRSRIIWF